MGGATFFASATFDDFLVTSIGGGGGTPPPAPTGLTAHARQRSGDVELERFIGGDQLQRQALDDERRPLYDDRHRRYLYKLYKHPARQRNDVFLCGLGGERRGRERQLKPGQRDAAECANSASGADRAYGPAGQRAGVVELERLVGASSYNVKRSTDERRALHNDRHRRDLDQFYKHRPDQRDDVFLRGFGGELSRRERQLKPGQRDAAECTNSASRADQSGGHSRQRSWWL